MGENRAVADLLGRGGISGNRPELRSDVSLSEWKQEFFHGYEWIVVPSCFAIIYLVGLFYMILGGAVITELRKIPSR